MILPELNQLPSELEELILFFITLPVEPADLVVLAISVIVAVLRPAPLVASGQHRHALRKKKRRQEIPALALAQRVDLRVIRWAFDPAIPRLIVVVAVAVLVAVQLVVLFVVADQIDQREPIVGSDEIDARVWATPVVLIKIGTAGEPVSHLADSPLVAFPKAPHRVPIFAVPFRPEHGKIPDLIAAFAHVPRFGD